MINKAINFFAANPRADIEIVRGIKASGGRLTMPQEELESMSPIFRPRISNELVPHSTYDAAARVESTVSPPNPHGRWYRHQKNHVWSSSSLWSCRGLICSKRPLSALLLIVWGCDHGGPLSDC